MTQFLRTRFDIGFVVVLLLCSITAIPLLSNPGLPNGSDVLYHTYRVAEMDRSWSHGVLFPSWAEGFYYGYGSPLFHYYAGLSYYITSVFIRILSVTPLDALRILIMLSMWGCGAGMYLFMRQQVGRFAGILAALVYVFSPYLLYTEPYARGTYPELLAFAFFPFVLWLFSRLQKHPTVWRFVSAAISLTVLIYTHNLMAVVMSAVLLSWLMWNFLWDWRIQQPLWQYRWLGLATVLGIGLAAGFWLPVVLERDAITLENVTGVALLDYRNFFVPLTDLFAGIPRNDVGMINGLRNLTNLGVVQWGFALLGVVGSVVLWLRTRNYPHSRLLGYYVLLVAVTIFLMTPSAQFIWDAIAPLAIAPVSMAVVRYRRFWFGCVGRFEYNVDTILATPFHHSSHWFVNRTTDTCCHSSILCTGVEQSIC